LCLLGHKFFAESTYHRFFFKSIFCAFFFFDMAPKRNRQVGIMTPPKIKGDRRERRPARSSRRTVNIYDFTSFFQRRGWPRPARRAVEPLFKARNSAHCEKQHPCRNRPFAEREQLSCREHRG
jgi:hypothetical protein